MAKLPIVLIDGHDVSIFNSLLEAACYIEPVDVNEYIIFDASGEVLKAEVADNNVVIKPQVPPLHNEKYLKDELLYQLELKGINKVNPADRSIDELIMFMRKKGKM